MRHPALVLTGASLLVLAAPAVAQPAKPAPVSELVKRIDIPYQQFTLKNGLRVVVHTDRKAPVVGVAVWYDVGSVFEPAGKTGFAHLFEHLMFNGSENAPGEFFAPLKAVGATGSNGTTSFDRTNYYQTVPVGALPLALFLESDRMGYLLGAVNQAVLDEQRGVVQNEKRGNDNQPYGLLGYKIFEGLFPEGHPYHHLPIGSMADLDAASLADVKAWFRANYGPNNAVLVLSGDVDAKTARPLVEKYFGAIPRGPNSARPSVTVPTLAAPRSEVLKDRVASTLISRNWAAPGMLDPGHAALQVAAAVLGGLASSRLDNALVKQDQSVIQVSAGVGAQRGVSTFGISAIVKPGVDPAKVNARIDQVVAEFLRDGPSADEIQRVQTSLLSRRLSGLETVGGKGGVLAQGALYANDPGYEKKYLTQFAAVTPAAAKAAANRWLNRPALTVMVEPGERGAYAEAVVPPPAKVVEAPTQPAKGTRGSAPGVGDIARLEFPAVIRMKLSNGIEVVYAQRGTVPVTQAIISFDAGVAADPAGKGGLGALTMGMLDEGVGNLDSIRFAEAKERLGVDIGAGSSNDRATVSFRAPSANLAAGLDLWAGVVRRPAFPEAEFGRVKNQQLAVIAQSLTSPSGLAQRVWQPAVYGPTAAYGRPGNGTAASVGALTRADLLAYQQAWLRPDKAKLFVVSDRPLAELKPLLEARFGDWAAAGAAGTKAADVNAPVAPKIVLVNRPNTPQSLVVAAIPTGIRGTDDFLPLSVGNDALGGDFLSRLNLDLRETKHWAYGASGGFSRNLNAAPYLASASVQVDKTGPSLAAIRENVVDYLSTKPMTQAEYDAAATETVRSLAGNFETAQSVLAAMMTNDLYRRPDDYYATLPARVARLDRGGVQAAMTATIDPKKAIWVVVGDAAKVKPQLDSLGLPVEVVEAAALAEK